MNEDFAAQDPLPTIYTDVAPDMLEADDPAPRTARAVLTGAWTDYLRRVLPSAAADGSRYSAASA
jgi:hypothetical protein